MKLMNNNAIILRRKGVSHNKLKTEVEIFITIFLMMKLFIKIMMA